jgi:hypothetical protein
MAELALAAGAQPPTKDPITASDARLAANPLLAEIQRIMPDQLPAVEAKLKEFGTNPAGGSRAGSSKPTASEATQIAQNPDIAEAYNHDPADTLALLRWLNQRIR